MFDIILLVYGGCNIYTRDAWFLFLQNLEFIESYIQKLNVVYIMGCSNNFLYCYISILRRFDWMKKE